MTCNCIHGGFPWDEHDADCPDLLAAQAKKKAYEDVEKSLVRAKLDVLVEELLHEAHQYHFSVDALCGPGPDPCTIFRRRVNAMLEKHGVRL